VFDIFVFDLVFQYKAKEIGWEERHQNDPVTYFVSGWMQNLNSVLQ